MSTLLEKLTAYGASDYYGFHMPGHKRKLDMLGGVTPCQIDITEIDGFDDLHHAEGILREAQERAAETYHADETHFPGQREHGGNPERDPGSDQERR